jgi:hypothetical protein
MQPRNPNPVFFLLLAVTALFAASCSYPGGRVVHLLNKQIGTEATTKEFRKGDVLYTWNNVPTAKEDELKAIVADYMEVSPSDSLALSPYYDAKGVVVPGKMHTYWVYETAKFGVELEYTLTGKTMTVDVRITQKIGAQ